MNTLKKFFSIDIIIATILISIAFFPCCIIALLVKIKLGSPVFYHGERLGKNKKIFTIYKFRTLPHKAQQETIGAELLSAKHGLTTRFTEFLRDTRLDELPQLWNVMKGDMKFIGPRPERPEIYQEICQKIHNYDKRFAVKPGLLGYSQLFTPHGTPKRMRTLIDNYRANNKNSSFLIISIIFYTVIIIVKRIFFDLVTHYNDIIKNKVLRKRLQKRKAIRKYLNNVRVDITEKKYNHKNEYFTGRLININHDAFLICTHNELSLDSPLIYTFSIPVTKRKNSFVSHKIAKCSGYIGRVEKSPLKNYEFSYVVFYQAISPLNEYLIDQYMLHISLA